MVCRRITVAAAMTTGSMLARGIEPHAPRSNKRICRLSAAEVITPARPPMVPGRSDHHVLAEYDIGFWEAVEEPVLDHCSSARSITVGPSPLRNSPTTPVFAIAVVTSSRVAPPARM